MHPRSRVQLCSGRTHTRYNEHTGITRRSRTQWLYDLFRALLGDRAGLPPSSADRFCLSPVGPTQLRKLDASIGASEPHDFVVRCNVSRPLALRLLTGREACPAIFRAQNAAASTATHPAFVTMANAPLVGWDGKSSRSVSGWVKTEIFLQGGLDTNMPDGQITCCRSLDEATGRAKGVS
jgi:hypothetical protein